MNLDVQVNQAIRDLVGHLEKTVTQEKKEDLELLEYQVHLDFRALEVHQAFLEIQDNLE